MSSPSCCVTLVSGGRIVAAVIVCCAPVAADTPAWEQLRELFQTGHTAPCSYTRTTRDENGTTMERFDALAAQPWSLVLVDGHTPSVDDRETYGERTAERAGRTSPDQFVPADFIVPESVERTGTYPLPTFSFRLRPEDPDRQAMVDALLGELSVTGPDAHQARIVITNERPVPYAPLVRIDDYRRVIEFGWHDGLAGLARTRELTAATGKAFGLKSIALESMVIYGELDCM